MKAISYSSTAPVTPPATPAIIHYRGASFDLVNPHDSLLLHDIVTPSQEFDSSDYLALRTSEEIFAESVEMARKRPLYGDVDAARAGILQRLEDAAKDSFHRLPSAPTPTAVSPSSSSYTSPMYSPESVNAPPPLATRRPATESRFSLKQLTRSLSRKVGRDSALDEGQELQVMRSEPTTVSRPSEYDYVSTPQASYFPGHYSPLRPNIASRERHTYDDTVYSSMSPIDHEVEYPRRHTHNLYDEEGLTSMIPDDPSTQVGRIDGSKISQPEDATTSKAYYDDLDSIYPSSSIYTGEGQRLSNYQQSLTSNRLSKPFLRYSSVGASDFTSDQNRQSFAGYSDVHRLSYQASRPATQDFHHQSVDQGNANTDTISKIIDEYSPEEVASNPSLGRLDEAAVESPNRTSLASGFFDIHLRSSEEDDNGPGLTKMGSVPSRRPTITVDPSRPPQDTLPLEPAFEYDDIPFLTPPRMGAPVILSNDSSLYSYGDTQNLLQMGQSEVAVPKAQRQALGSSSSYSQVEVGRLEPSSSYSQDEVKVIEPSSSYSQTKVKLLEPSSSYSQKTAQSPGTPQKALDEAERIFQEAFKERKREEEKLPAMWALRGLGSQVVSKNMHDRSSGASYDAVNTSSARNSKDVAMDKADWETVAGNSLRGRDSMDSLADYSSSESSRNVGQDADDLLPSWDTAHHPGSSKNSHPSEVRDCPYDFGSSPPNMNGPTSSRTVPMLSSSPAESSPIGTRNTPMFPFHSLPEHVLGRGAVAYPLSPDPYALSDKETRELLASGPNDDILVDSDADSPERSLHIDGHYADHENHDMPATPTSVRDESGSTFGLERVNTFEKRTVVGPLGNLTGTPHGSGMQHTGSSIADNSSPGMNLSSAVARNSMRRDRKSYAGFYASSFPALSSVTRISPPQPQQPNQRMPTRLSLTPRPDSMVSVQDSPPPPFASSRGHLRKSTKFYTSRRHSRPAVPGQTKLRQMLLASDDDGTVSSQGKNFSRLLHGSRPSTGDTITPLFPSHLNMEALGSRNMIAHQHSPHLLCPERGLLAEDEARRRTLSWLILALFCLLPPCIILFRWFGDTVIISITKGRLGHTSAQSKRVALIAGIAVNIGLVTAILVPILVWYGVEVA